MLYVTVLPFDFMVLSYGFYQDNFVNIHIAGVPLKEAKRKLVGNCQSRKSW